MKTACSFLVKFASIISWALSCFDRVLFKGHLPISRTYEFENFVDYVLKMRRADFMETLAPQWSNRLVQYAKGFADKAGRLYEYLQGEVDKDAWAKKQLEALPLAEGLNALSEAAGDIDKAAVLLNTKPAALQRKLKKLGIQTE